MPPDMSKIKIPAGKKFFPFSSQSMIFNCKDGISPGEAAIIAVIANPKLRVVRDKRKIASAQLLQAGILPNPSFSYNIGIPAHGEKNNKVYSFGFGLGWDISSLIMRSIRMDAAKADASSIDLEIAWQEWQVAEDARLHAWNLIFAEKRLALVKSKKTILKKILNNTIKSVDMGTATKLDLSMAETAMQEAELSFIDEKAKINRERLEFNRAAGFPPGKIIPMEKDIVPLSEKCPPVKTLFNYAMEKRLDLAALRLGYKSEEARVRGAVYSQFPKINIGLTREKDTDGLKTTGFGINIELPFFDRSEGHIAMERASRRKLYDEYVFRVFKARSDIASLVQAIKSIRKKITGVDNTTASLKIFVKNCRIAAYSGRIDIFSYYKALENLFTIQIHRIDFEQKIIDRKIGLEIASGCYGLVRQTKLKTAKQ